MCFVRTIISNIGCFVKKICSDDALDDEAFYNSYYAATSVPKDIPIRLRMIFVEKIGSKRKLVTPAYDPIDECEDLDFADILEEVEAEFGISIPERDRDKLEGSFDSFVQYIARIRSR